MTLTVWPNREPRVRPRQPEELHKRLRRASNIHIESSATVSPADKRSPANQDKRRAEMLREERRSSAEIFQQGFFQTTTDTMMHNDTTNDAYANDWYNGRMMVNYVFNFKRKDRSAVLLPSTLLFHKTSFQCHYLVISMSY